MEEDWSIFNIQVIGGQNKALKNRDSEPGNGDIQH